MNIQLYSTSSSSSAGTITNVTLSAPGISWTKQVGLAEGDMVSVEAPDEVEAVRDYPFQNCTIIITADRDVYVTAVSYAAPDSTVTFPVVPYESAAGYEFFVVNYSPATPLYPAEIMITSEAEESYVTVQKPPGVTAQEFRDSLSLESYEHIEISEDKIRVFLSPYQSIQWRFSGDFTGYHLTAVGSPVTIISGGECMYVPSTEVDCDPIAAYIPPVNQLGRHHIIAPFAGRNSGYIYRVVAVRDDTRLTINLADNRYIATAGEFFEADILGDEITIVNSDNPVLVAQYAKGYTSDIPARIGDPLMLIVTPQEQYTNIISFAHFDMSSYMIPTNYLNLQLSCDQLEGVLINGNEFDSNEWEILRSGDNVECLARKALDNTDQVHDITHRSSQVTFAAFVNGAGTAVSYGHNLDHTFTQPTCTVPDGVNTTKEVNCGQGEFLFISQVYTDFVRNPTQLYFQYDKRYISTS